MIRLLPLLALVGCSPIGVYAPGAESGIQTAIDVGMPVKEGDEDSLIRVRVRPSIKIGGGHAFDTRGCVRQAYVKRADNDPVTAHEIGHTLGLGHSDDPRNVMYPGKIEGPVFLTREQRREMRQARAVLSACQIVQ